MDNIGNAVTENRADRIKSNTTVRCPMATAEVNDAHIGLLLLADHTHSRAYATMLRPSSCDVMYCGKRCVQKQKLLLTAYKKSYRRNRLAPK